MNKTLFHVAFVACVTATGCASPLRLFSKKPQPFDEYVAQQKAKNQARVPSSNSLPNSPAEVAESLRKGHAAFQQGLMPDAQANYLAVLQRQPDHAEANHRLAVIADRQSDFVNAEKYYRTAIAAAPHDANILNDLGYSYLLQARYPEAEQYLTAALRQSPTQANAINNLGVLYAKQGQVDRALAQFRRTGSEAEAQAKLTRSLPAIPSASPTGTLLASNTWPPPQTTPVNNAGLNNIPQRPNGAPPQASPADFSQPAPGQTPLNPSLAAPQYASNAAPSSINDPNISEAARQLKYAMELKRQEAIAARIAQDTAERQRQAAILRQARDAELGRSAGAPTAAPINGDNRAPQPPTGPIVVGPPPSNPNAGTMPGQYRDAVRGFAASPQTQFPANTGPGVRQLFDGPNPSQGQVPQSSFAPATIANSMPNGPQNNPNVNPVRGNPVSPLDAMPTWPPQDFVPATTPNSLNGPSGFAPPQSGWPNGTAGNMTADPARAASHWGMNAGPGNLFPTNPGQSANGPGAGNAPNGYPPANGVAPNQNRPAVQGSFPYGSDVPQPLFGPPVGGQSSGQPMPESPTQYELQGQVPPSEQYQTPSGFGAWGVPNGAAGQPLNFTPNRAAPPRNYPTPNPRELISEMERASTRSTAPDRAGGDDRWEELAPPPGSATNFSAPTIQGFLATPAGEKALAEYERMNQRHNAEANLIRQQIDAQRQLPASENYIRSTTQPQLGTPTGTNPNSIRPTGGAYSR